MLDDRENEVFSAVVPIFGDFLAEVELARLRIDHRVVDLAHEDHFGGSPRKLLKGHLELQLCIFVQSVANEQHSVPDCVREGLLSRVSSCGMI